ncbi:MAG: amidohydrolase [Pseudomonadales bacterium]|nr:amidohydrolase [Pseudomonadales bacterium]MDG1444676.1 amidohydrolase [Pseudomonadales bacterium]
MSITIYQAKKIITMNPSNPQGTHAAVRDGLILGVGSLSELEGWGEYELDTSFSDHIIVPGFVEAHAHVMAGGMMLLPYMGYFERKLADGSTAPGIKSYAELISALKEAEAKLTDPDEPLVAVGFDPIYFPGQPRLSRHELDQVSSTRPIYLQHASGHLATVNTPMLVSNGVTKEMQVEGLGRQEDGELDGELREPAAMGCCKTGNRIVQGINQTEQALRDFGALACNAGITTCTDLGGASLIAPKLLDRWQNITAEASFPLRIAQYNIPAMPGASAAFDQIADQFVALRKQESEKLRFPGIKFILDGSIQGFSALIDEPGYYSGEDHGQLLTVPEQFADWLRPFHRASINVHMHCNGNLTQQLAIDTVEKIVREDPWLDHRHTITHAQLTTQAQLRKMARLGLCANFFTNHLWYWGDQHYDITVGPERANSLEPCASALREGVSFSIHSDAGVTPLGSLHTMWCAVNRLTPSGRVLGEVEKISPYEALKAVTISGAYQLHLDHEVGSLEAGKKADFAVLQEDPLVVDPMSIRDIKVWGTVLAGTKHQAAG